MIIDCDTHYGEPLGGRRELWPFFKRAEHLRFIFTEAGAAFIKPLLRWLDEDVRRLRENRGIAEPDKESIRWKSAAKLFAPTR